MLCNQCPRLCNALRDNQHNIGGFCGMPDAPTVSRAALHFWEEPSISGTSGSGTIFFSGCSLQCIYCQNGDISIRKKGKAITVNQLADIFKRLEDSGAHNINLVTPTHYIHSIIAALDIYKPSIPIVYNSSGYENIESLQLLKDYIDIYLMDFKYFSPDKAQKYSYAFNYPQVCINALKEAYRQQPKCIFNNEGIMQKGVIVRHLLLPSATRDAIEIFNWVKNNISGAYFSFMSQYIPLENAKDYKEINRKVTLREYNKVVTHIADSGFKNCYVQELSSAKSKYIPDFDFTGID